VTNNFYQVFVDEQFDFQTIIIIIMKLNLHL
jgi:hypothetical protein